MDRYLKNIRNLFIYLLIKLLILSNKVVQFDFKHFGFQYFHPIKLKALSVREVCGGD